ncbi:MAG: DUF2271 domain-containing protein [Ilumatobacter sp.]
MGIVAIATGCGDEDAAVFDGARIPAPAASPETVDTSAPVTETTVLLSEANPADEATSTTATEESSTTSTSSTASTTTQPTAVDNGAASALPDGGELLVDFTFTATSTGERIHNPYIAVWIEDLDGNVVDTVSLGYQTGGRGTRWLRTLRQWSDLTGEVVDATSSGATRPAGEYTVAWDGLDASGSPITPGTYQLFVEAAREDGPYELSSATLEFDGNEFTVQLPDDGELSALSARVVA